MSNIVYVSVEGNIGGGKTTIIGHIRQRFPNYRIVDEPVHIWQALKDTAGKSLLANFYSDRSRWSYTFQNAAFITRIMGASAALEKAKSEAGQDEKIVIISERGILTDRHVFASMLRVDGSMNPLEWELYTYWFDHFSKNVKTDGIIYVTTQSDVCKDRIKIRGRQGEEGISQEYLDELHKYHENWLNNTELPVLRISSEPSELEKVESFVQSL
jgi:deoxyadenosine/deoxycytidine kinase